MINLQNSYSLSPWEQLILCHRGQVCALAIFDKAVQCSYSQSPCFDFWISWASCLSYGRWRAQMWFRRNPTKTCLPCCARGHESQVKEIRWPARSHILKQIRWSLLHPPYCATSLSLILLYSPPKLQYLANSVPTRYLSPLSTTALPHNKNLPNGCLTIKTCQIVASEDCLTIKTCQMVASEDCLQIKKLAKWLPQKIATQ